MRISLVIPAFNEEKYIGETLRSVFEHAPGAFEEVIVVDNASSDETAKVAASFPGVIVVSEPRKGTGFAREAGFRAASGDVIAFIDADTRIRAGWAERISSAFERDSSLACISGPYWYYDLSRPVAGIIISTWYAALPLFYFIKTFVIGGNFAIRRTVLEQMGGFDLSIVFHGDDIDVGKRASRFGAVRPDPFLIVDSSGRRFLSRGIVKTCRVYLSNSFSAAFRRHPNYTPGYDEVR